MTQPPRPIPIPPGQRLTDLRTRFLPLLVFGAALVGTILLWRDALAPSMLVGEVTAARATLSSPVPSTLERLHVRRLQTVKAGEVVAELRANDSRHLFDMIQNELALLRLDVSAGNSTHDGLTAQHRLALDLDRLRLDLLAEKVALILAQSAAQKAALDLQLAEKMAEPAADPGNFLQLARLAREKAESEVRARQALVDALEPRVASMTSALAELPPIADAGLRASIESLQQRLALIGQDHAGTVLRAPIDGLVTAVLRHPGDNVLQAEPLIVITATQPESIIGYLRQPFPLQPVVGQPVKVRSHGRDRRQSTGTIIRVGAHFEPILNPALQPGLRPEAGLPVEISLPPDLPLRPGELVGLVLLPEEAAKPSL